MFEKTVFNPCLRASCSSTHAWENAVQPMFESKLFFHPCKSNKLFFHSYLRKRGSIQPMFESKLFFHLWLKTGYSFTHVGEHAVLRPVWEHFVLPARVWEQGVLTPCWKKRCSSPLVVLPPSCSSTRVWKDCVQPMFESKLFFPRVV